MLLAELIQRVQSLYSKGVHSDDTRLSSRHIYSKIQTVRARLLEQKLNKRQKISQWDYQTIGCIELEEVPISECPCTVPEGCKALRSKLPIPGVMTDLNKHWIQSVTSLHGNIIFSEVSWTERKYKSGNKYTKNSPDFFLRDNYLYIIYNKHIKAVSMTALFEDPFEVEKFKICCDGDVNCESPLYKDYPIGQGDIDTLVELARQELVESFNRNIEDSRNNTSDSSQEQSK